MLKSSKYEEYLVCSAETRKSATDLIEEDAKQIIPSSSTPTIRASEGVQFQNITTGCTLKVDEGLGEYESEKIVYQIVRRAVVQKDRRTIGKQHTRDMEDHLGYNSVEREESSRIEETRGSLITTGKTSSPTDFESESAEEKEERDMSATQPLKVLEADSQGKEENTEGFAQEGASFDDGTYVEGEAGTESRTRVDNYGALWHKNPDRTR